jgi:DNA-binding beta-propeller fold protein YncE
MTRNLLNEARMAIIAEYEGGERALYFAHFVPDPTGAPGIILDFNDLTANFPVSLRMDDGIVPYSLALYDELTVFVDDATNATLHMYNPQFSEDAALRAITVQNFSSIGTTPMGMAPDPKNGRVFIADYGNNAILAFDMDTLTLSPTTYPANYHPSELVFLPDAVGSGGRLGTILTDPLPLFYTFDITE